VTSEEAIYAPQLRLIWEKGTRVRAEKRGTGSEKNDVWMESAMFVPELGMDRELCGICGKRITLYASFASLFGPGL
jgi:hypothetical protein